MSFFSDTLLLFVLIASSSTFLSQYNGVDGVLVDGTVLGRSAVQPVFPTSSVAHMLTQPNNAGAFSLELTGILKLVPFEGQLKKVCMDTLTKFASTHCPFGDLTKPNSADASSREKIVLSRARRHELSRRIFAEHEMHFLQSQVERIIDQCCNGSVLSQPSTVINNNNNGCHLKTAEGLIEHACKPGVQRSGDILNG